MIARLIYFGRNVLCIKCAGFSSSAYGNTVQNDLWDALQNQTDIEDVLLPVSLETIMETWTRQMGFPIITINRLYDANNNATASQV
jgi:aminopeptidase N